MLAILLLVEGVQLFTGTGSCDVDDVILNLAGALLAYDGSDSPREVVASKMLSSAAMIPLTKAQARRFLLLKQGLLGARRFEGKQGVLNYIAQAGCIQFDPVDICGKSPEIALQARVKGFRKSMLYTYCTGIGRLWIILIR